MQSTPILDLEQPPPKPPSLWGAYLIGLLVGLLPVSFLILHDLGYFPGIRRPEINRLAVLPALLVAIAVHESGHALAGWSVGMGVGGIWVGPFSLIRSGRRWVFRFDLKSWCSAAYRPRILAADLGRWNYIWMVLGGLLASLILLTSSGYAYSRYGSGTWEWIETLFWVTAFALPVSLYPYSAGLFKSDAAKLWLMIRHPEQAKPWLGLLSILIQEARGVRPREWNADQFDAMLSSDGSDPEYPFCQLFAYYRRMDEGVSDQALLHLDKALAASSGVGKPVRKLLFAEAASASAVYRKRPVNARTWRERSCAVGKSESLDGLDAEIAMSEGRYDAALKHLEAATAYLERLGLDSGLVRFIEEDLSAKKAACRAAIDEAAS